MDPEDTEVTRTHGTTLDDEEASFQEESDEDRYLEQDLNWNSERKVAGLVHPGDQQEDQREGLQQVPSSPKDSNQSVLLDGHMDETEPAQQASSSSTEPSLTPVEIQANTCPACGCFVFAGGAHCLNPDCIYWCPPVPSGEGFSLGWGKSSWPLVPPAPSFGST